MNKLSPSTYCVIWSLELKLLRYYMSLHREDENSIFWVGYFVWITISGAWLWCRDKLHWWLIPSLELFHAVDWRGCKRMCQILYTNVPVLSIVAAHTTWLAYDKECAAILIWSCASHINPKCGWPKLVFEERARHGLIFLVTSLW